MKYIILFLGDKILTALKIQVNQLYFRCWRKNYFHFLQIRFAKNFKTLKKLDRMLFSISCLLNLNTAQ